MRERGGIVGEKGRKKKKVEACERESLVLSSGPHNFQLIYKKVLYSVT